MRAKRKIVMPTGVDECSVWAGGRLVGLAGATGKDGTSGIGLDWNGMD